MYVDGTYDDRVYGWLERARGHQYPLPRKSGGGMGRIHRGTSTPSWTSWGTYTIFPASSPSLASGLIIPSRPRTTPRWTRARGAGSRGTRGCCPTGRSTCCASTSSWTTIYLYTPSDLYALEGGHARGPRARRMIYTHVPDRHHIT